MVLNLKCVHQINQYLAKLDHNKVQIIIQRKMLMRTVNTRKRISDRVTIDRRHINRMHMHHIMVIITVTTITITTATIEIQLEYEIHIIQ